MSIESRRLPPLLSMRVPRPCLRYVSGNEKCLSGAHRNRRVGGSVGNIRFGNRWSNRPRTQFVRTIGLFKIDLEDASKEASKRLQQQSGGRSLSSFREKDAPQIRFYFASNEIQPLVFPHGVPRHCDTRLDSGIQKQNHFQFLFFFL